ITSGGTLVRTRVEEVSIMGRNTQGVRLIRLGDDEQLTGMARIANIKTENDDEIDPEDDGENSQEANSADTDTE
ncbi:MAG: hypothetical protein OEY65_07915, partial [Gammaproteobacteria bacterium]|nr:hypothetical protein [Gammaproteobacteria bacterium]